MTPRLGFADFGGDVTPDREQRVKRAVLEEIRSVARRRHMRRRAYIAAGMLSVAAVSILTVRPASRATHRPAAPDLVATVDRVDGDVRRIAASRDVEPPLRTRTDWDRIAISQALSAGDEIETGIRGRVGLRWPGASLRLDRRTRVRLASARIVELSAGALYFDGEHDFSSLEIVTPHGRVMDIGTQFEVRIDDDSLRVRVRSGIVEVRHKGEVLSAHASTQLTMGEGGQSTRAVLPYGPEWAWTAALAPSFETNGRPLHAFLDHLCREHGWTLTYHTASLQQDAARILLHGSLGRLDVMDALDAALSASGLRYRLDRGELVVER